MNWIWIALGGACGSLARHAVNVACVRPNAWTWAGLPMGTLWVNTVGSFLFGLAIPLLAPGSSVARSFLLVGLLGGFTTFSTFAFQTSELLSQGETTRALLNFAANNLLAILGACLGLWIGQRLS